MKIYRHTLRADGKTVGQAMDEDAKFLRSIGIDAKDGQPTFDEKQEAFIDKVESAILDTLDKVSPTGKGWEDKDLSTFLPTIRKHAEELFNRLYDNGIRKF